MGDYLDLMRHLPPYYRGSETINGIMNTEAVELGSLRNQIDDLLKQFYISTATWGLAIWEEDYGITPNLDMTYEQRRQRLTLKKNFKPSINADFIERLAQNFAGNGVSASVTENVSPYTFILQLKNINGDVDYVGIRQAVEEVKPAHLSMVVNAVFDWSLLANRSYGGVISESNAVTISLKPFNIDPLSSYRSYGGIISERKTTTIYPRA